MSRDQTNFPLSNSKQLRMPVAPSVKTRSPAMVGRSARADAGYGGLVAGRIGVLPEACGPWPNRSRQPAPRGRVAPELQPGYPQWQTRTNLRRQGDAKLRAAGAWPSRARGGCRAGGCCARGREIAANRGRRARWRPLLRPQWPRPQYSTAIPRTGTKSPLIPLMRKHPTPSAMTRTAPPK